MIDLHTHILPGLDDGAETLEEAVDLCREAWRSGVRQIVATPHVRDDYPTTRAQIDDGLAALRRALADRGIPLTLHAGAELDVRRAASMSHDDLMRLTIGARGRYMLVEVPYSGSSQLLEAFATTLVRRGIVPILAHPERSSAFGEEPSRLAPLVRSGCLVQLTAGSLVGEAGRKARRTALHLLDRGLVHLVASDVHGHGIARSGMRRGVSRLDARLAAYLTQEAPAAILAGEPVGPPPARSGRRLWRGLAVST